MRNKGHQQDANRLIEMEKRNKKHWKIKDSAFLSEEQISPESFSDFSQKIIDYWESQNKRSSIIKKNDDTKINVPKIQTDIVGDSVVLEDATPVKTISEYKSIIQQLESELTTLKDKYIQKLEDNDKLHKENKELSNQLQHYHKSKFN